MNVLDGLQKENCSTEAAIMRGKQGDKEALEYLVGKYESIVKRKASAYFLVGSDREDVIQEGLIGLYKAICDYDDNKRTTFKTFAELCITRQIISSVKSATRLKHTPLNSYISIHKPILESETERTLLDTIDNEAAVDPFNYVVYKEKNLEFYNDIVKALTRLEWKVFHLYLQGMTYKEIARLIGRSEKAIDNALQRVKKKVDLLMEKNNKELIVT